MTELLEIIFYILLGSWILILLPHVIRGLVLLFSGPDEDSNDEPPISILIAARNEEKNLKVLLPKLLEQNYNKYEVVIALDRCTDNSLSLCKTFERQYDNIHIVIIDELPDQFSPKKYALSLAVKAAKYEWLLFTDADCFPASENWISCFGQKMTDQVDFVLGYSPYERKKGFINGFIQYETFLTAYDYLSSAKMKFPYMGVGRNMAYRKSVFLRVNGYNRFQGIMGGDDDLFVHYHANPKRVVTLTGIHSLTYSESKNTLKEYWKQKKRHLSVSKFYKLGSRIRLSFKFLIHLLLWVSFFILAVYGYRSIWVVGLFLSYLIFKSLINRTVAKRLGEGYRYELTLLFEGFYITFLPLLGLIATFSKKVKWN